MFPFLAIINWITAIANVISVVTPHIPPGTSFPDITHIEYKFEYNTTSDHQVYTPILNLLEEKCMNATGDSEHFPKVLNKMISINQCMNEIINKTAIEYEPLGQTHEIFNRTCRQQERFRNCSQGVNPIDVCLTAEELVQKQINLNITISSFTYFCENDGELFTGLFTLPGITCLIKKSDQLSGCRANIFEKLVTGSSTELIPKLLCSDVNEFHECVLPILNQCELQNVAEKLVGYANVLRQEINCVTN